MAVWSECLSGVFPKSRILLQPDRWPFGSALLRLSETIVDSGQVRRPLEFYHAVVNEWVGGRSGSTGRGDASSRAILCDVCTESVAQLSGAIAVSQQGISVEPGIEVNLLFLLASPSHAVPSFQRTLRDLRRILQSNRRVETILACSSSGDVQALLELCAIESEAALPGR